jgi:LysR family transcriptional regulator, transcription activator of glutamate synthase operon
MELPMKLKVVSLPVLRISVMEGGDEDLNITFIEGFLESARLKSLAKASEKLNLSHPALSKQINSLEAYYGVKFFHRSPAGVTLTEHGKLFYDRILPVYEDLIQIKKDFSIVAESHRYKIGTLPSMAYQYLPKIVLELESKGILVDIEIRETSRELEELLNHGDIHAAVMELQPHNEAYWSVKLFEEPYETVVYPGHRFSALPSVSLLEISREPLILNPPDCSTRILISKLIEEYGVKPSVEKEVKYGEFILGYVAARAGITFAPLIEVDQIQKKGLICVPIDDPQAKRCISLVCSSGRIGKLLQRFFVEF